MSYDDNFGAETFCQLAILPTDLTLVTINEGKEVG
jgi:hypothetical protein